VKIDVFLTLLHDVLSAMRRSWPIAARNAGFEFGFSSMDVISGAGHDAVYLARVAPAAMIFVPCKDGISHNEIEDARADHLEAGCNVLLQAMLNAAQTAGSTEA
jgi:N-carbamoyl-L-amino-acid hydrolase